MTAQVFLVGGAVRDLAMGLEPKDLDFVVVGSSPEEMEALGFERVGADFPVFLHPVTRDEFALARTERKVGEGHTGFECDWEGVTLEEDLRRRDLTINAMAVEGGTLEEALADTVQDEMDESLRDVLSGKVTLADFGLVDPFGGMVDLERTELRHVSEHFAEDPLRVLRVARFMARFGEPWGVNWDTLSLMKKVFDENVSELTPERVWKEVSRALMERAPERFFALMDSFTTSEGNPVFCPELTNLKVVEQRPDFHPEGDAFKHTLLCLRAAADMGADLPTRFAVLCHDFGKRPAFDENTARGEGHLGGHEKAGVPLVEALCERWRVPNECRDLAVLVTRDHLKVHTLAQLRPATVAKMLTSWGLLQEGNEGTVQRVLDACTADVRGRGESHVNDVHPSTTLLPLMANRFTDKVSVDALFAGRERPQDGRKIGEAVHRERVRRLAELKQAVV